MSLKQSLTYLQKLVARNQALQGPFSSVASAIKTASFSPSADLDFEAKFEIKAENADAIKEALDGAFAELDDHSHLEGSVSFFAQKAGPDQVFVEAMIAIDMYYFHMDVKEYVSNNLRGMTHSAKDLTRSTKDTVAVGIIETARSFLAEEGFRTRRSQFENPRVLVGNKTKKAIGRILRNHLEEV